MSATRPGTSAQVLAILAGEEPWTPPTEGKLFAVLDGARDERIHARCLAEPGEAWALLYKGALTPALSAAAPHLVSLGDGRGELCRWLVEEGYGQSFGVFARSSASLADLTRHFRTFLMVKTEQGEQIYFRYYDPRVLRIYLPTCEPEELEHVFGPVDEYLLEGEEPDTLTRFHLAEGGKLAETQVPLEVAAPPPPLEMGEVVGAITRLKELLSAARSDPSAGAAAVAETLSALRALQARAAGQAGPEHEELRGKLRQVLGRLEHRKELDVRTASASVTSLLVGLKAQVKG